VPGASRMRNDARATAAEPTGSTVAPADKAPACRRRFQHRAGPGFSRGQAAPPAIAPRSSAGATIGDHAGGSSVGKLEDGYGLRLRTQPPELRQSGPQRRLSRTHAHDVPGRTMIGLVAGEFARDRSRGRTDGWPTTNCRCGDRKSIVETRSDR